MKHRLTHIAPLFFLFFLLLPLISLLMLQAAQWLLQNTAEERMEHHQLVTLTLPASKVVWEKKGKELNINGKLFDIKTFEVSDGTLNATGFYDDDEASLFRLLSAFTSPDKNNAFLRFLLVMQCFAGPLLFLLIRQINQGKLLHHSFFSLDLPRPFCPGAEQPPKAKPAFFPISVYR